MDNIIFRIMNLQSEYWIFIIYVYGYTFINLINVFRFFWYEFLYIYKLSYLNSSEKVRYNKSFQKSRKLEHMLINLKENISYFLQKKYIWKSLLQKCFKTSHLNYKCHRVHFLQEDITELLANFKKRFNLNWIYFNNVEA